MATVSCERASWSGRRVSCSRASVIESTVSFLFVMSGCPSPSFVAVDASEPPNRATAFCTCNCTSKCTEKQGPRSTGVCTPCLCQPGEEVLLDLGAGNAHAPQHALIRPHHVGRTGEVEGALAIIRRRLANHPLVNPAPATCPGTWDRRDVRQREDRLDAKPRLSLSQHVLVDDLIRGPIRVEQDRVAPLVRIHQILEHAAERRDAYAAREKR